MRACGGSSPAPQFNLLSIHSTRGERVCTAKPIQFVTEVAGCPESNDLKQKTPGGIAAVSDGKIGENKRIPGFDRFRLANEIPIPEFFQTREQSALRARYRMLLEARQDAIGSSERRQAFTMRPRSMQRAFRLKRSHQGSRGRMDARARPYIVVW